jgi:hypothetical protein
MTKPMISIHDLTTDEITTREMNDEEFVRYESEMAALQAEQNARATKAAEKAALLAQLGITDDQAKLLLL